MNTYGALATAAAVMALTSCEPPKTYDVMKLGPDTYSVSATAFQTMGGVTAARTAARAFSLKIESWGIPKRMEG